MKIRYDFINGEAKEVKATKEIYEAITEHTREVKNQNRREKRKHTSYDVLAMYDLEPSVEVDFIRHIETAQLKEAFKTLTADQKDLLHRIYYNGEKESDIARELGITKQSMNERVQRAIQRLKKFLKS